MILSYHDPASILRGSGYNPFPRDVGERVNAPLGALLAAGSIRPVVGTVVPFEALPNVLEEMESRTTTGRVMVKTAG